MSSLVASSVLILVVDDHEGWRRFLASTLAAKPQLKIVGDANNGLQAIEKAEQLQPDVILLDIGLPEVNGIEAATRILQLSPGSRIIFVTQETSPDVVDAALNAGAAGYVCKRNANRELVSAIEMALKDAQFVSTCSPAGHGSNITPQKPRSYRHEAIFYSDDAAFGQHFGEFIIDGLKAGKAVVVAATKPHYESIRESLAAASFDPDRAITQGIYVWIDAEETLSRILVNGLPDRQCFFDEIARLILSISKAMNVERPRIAFCGERVGLLWAEGHAEAACLIEQFCNELAEQFGFDILCAYPMLCTKDKDARATICADHTWTCAR